MKKVILVVIILSLLINTLGLAFKVQFAEASNDDFAFFDEVLIYEPGVPLITFCFAANGTIISNFEFNIHKLINGSIVRMFDIRPKRDQLDYYDLGQYYGIAIAPNGSLFVSINKEGIGRIYKVVNEQVFFEHPIFQRLGTVCEIAFHPNGELFYTDGKSIYSINGVKVLDSRDIGRIWNSVKITGFTFAPDGTLFVALMYYESIDSIEFREFHVIWKFVENKWQVVYIRPPYYYGGGIGDIAISPDGEIYFTGYPFFTCLFKLTSSAQMEIQNADFFPYRLYPLVTNSSVTSYGYNVDSHELKLNLTGNYGTLGVCIVCFFANAMKSAEEFQVQKDGEHAYFEVVKKSLIYYVCVKYEHAETISLIIKRLPGDYHSNYIFDNPLFILSVVVITGVVLSVALKNRIKNSNN